MYKLYRMMKFRSKGDETKTKLYDRAIARVRKMMFRLVIAVAMAAGVTPTKLSNAYDEDKIKDFLLKFNEKVRKKQEKKNKEVQDALKKAKVKVKKKTKK